MTTAKPAPPRPWLSGHCNPDNPANVHAQCAGSYEGRPCRCPHHHAHHVQGLAGQLHADANHFLTLDVDTLDWEHAVRAADELRKAKFAISAAEEFLAKRVSDQWPGSWRDAQPVDGIGSVEPYRTKNTQWDHDNLVSEVIEAHMARTGGEVTDPGTVVRWLTDAAHVDYWRVGELKAIGVDVEEYRHVKPGPVRLRFKAPVTVNDTIGDGS